MIFFLHTPFFLLLLSMMLVSPVSGWCIDAPHNAANLIDCGSCHDSSNPNNPLVVGSDINTFCIGCHLDADPNNWNNTTAPLVKGHTSVFTNSKYATTSQHGSWERKCTHCHDPHSQGQKYWKNTNATDLFLARGQIDSFSCDDGGADCQVKLNASQQLIDPITTLTYSGGSFKSGWTAADMGQKTTAQRGAVIMPNLSKTGWTFPVLAMDGTTITIKGYIGTGNVYQYKNPPTSFGIILGQYVRQYIDADNNGSAETAVKYLDHDGNFSFAKSGSTNICEVCHTDTGHWGTTAPGGDKHFSSLDCTECHRHADGFGPSWPDHDALVATPSFCNTCHNSNLFTLHNINTSTKANCSHCHEINDNLRFSGSLPYVYLTSTAYSAEKEKDMLSGTVKCDECHHGQFKEHVTDTGHGMVHDRALPGYDNDADGTADNWIGCDACHYSDIVEEHVTQRNFTCSTCHDSATASAKVTAAVTKGRSAAEGGSDTNLYCSECHNTTAGSPNGVLVDKHHVTTQAVNGDCIACHVVGFGVFGPSRAPCGNCHGNGKRFAYTHTKAANIDLAPTTDTRACFSCHLNGSPGFRSGITPPVVPLHALPATKPDLWPGDCRNAAEYLAGRIANLPGCYTPAANDPYCPGDEATDANDPNCFQCNDSEEQCDKFINILDMGQYAWTPATATETAVNTLLLRYPGFELINYYLPAEHVRNNVYDKWGALPWVTGTPMGTYAPNASSGANYKWLMAFLLPEIEANYRRPSVTNVTVPITYTDASSKTGLTINGTGSGGMPTGTNASLKVTISPAGAVTDGAQWRVDGLGWRDGDGIDAQSSLFAPGNHLVEFKPIAGWVSPEPATIAFTGGENKTVSGLQSTYGACPNDPQLTFVNAPTDITWSAPTATISYTVSGWQPEGKDLKCLLDTGGATGFVVVAGQNFCTMQKNDATAPGSYTFTLTAQASTCFDNEIAKNYVVTVDANGAPSPSADIGTVSAKIDEQVITDGAYFNMTTVAEDMVAVTTCATTTTCTIETWGVNTAGLIDNVRTSSQTISLPASYTTLLNHVQDDIFVTSRKDEMETVRIDATGIISPGGSAGIDSCTIPQVSGSSANIYGIYPGTDGRSLVGYRRGTGTFLQSIWIDETGDIACPISNTASDYLNIMTYGTAMDVIHINSNTYAVAIARAESGAYGSYLKTFVVNADSTITATGSSWLYHTGASSQVKLFRLGQTNIFGLAYGDGDGRLTIKTFRLENNGSIGNVISSMDLDPFVVGKPNIGLFTTLGVVDIGNNRFAVHFTYRLVPSSASSTSQFKSAIATIQIKENGILLPVLDSRTDTDLIGVMNQLNGDVFVSLFASASNSTEFLRTYIIDLDGDGAAAGSDNCPSIANADQADADGDGLGDVCDNCPSASNSTQADMDNDGSGDACDDDHDGDGAANDSDNCANNFNPAQGDRDTDGIGDACDANFLPAGAVGYWAFDSAVNGTAVDFINGNNGSITNAVLDSDTVSGYGKSYFFNGTSSVNLGNPAVLSFGTGDFALEAWFKTSHNSFEYIIGKGVNAATAGNEGYGLAVQGTDGSVFGTIHDGARLILFGGTGLNDNAWHHYVGNFDRNGNFTPYVDGVALTPGAISSYAGSVNNAAFNVYIGRYQHASAGHFNGYIDDVVIYGKTLTCSEIKSRCENFKGSGNCGAPCP